MKDNTELDLDYVAVIEKGIEFLEHGWATKPSATEHKARGDALEEATLEIPSTSLEGMSMQKITREIFSCRKCELCEQRKQPVVGMGVESPLVLIIGEAPGAQEDIQGQPFVGASGQYLDKWLEAIGLSRHENVYITNTVKCRPPGNRNPSENEVDACKAYLRAQVGLLRPKLILALGRVAGNILTGNVESRLSDLRKGVFEYQSIPLHITYHPSAVLRNPDDLRRPVWEDLQKVKQAITDIR